MKKTMTMFMIFAMIFFLVACASGGDALPDSYRIALVTALTGPVADSGTQGRYASELAVERVNAAGGINGAPIVIDIFDDRTDVAEAALVAQRIAENRNYLAVVGHLFSSVALAALPIYQEAGLPFFLTTANSMSIDGDNQIRMCLPGIVQGPQMAVFAAETLGSGKIAFIYAMGDFGVTMIEQISLKLEEIGTSEIVMSETFAAGTDRDFSAQLTKVLAAGADTVICIGNYTDVGMIIAQAGRIGGFENINFVGDASCLDSTFVTRVMESGLEENVYLVCAFNPYDDRQVYIDFFNDFNERYNLGDPTEPAAYFYDQIIVISEALKAGATKETLVSTIKRMTFTDMLSAGGEMTFDELGNRGGYEMPIVVVRDGRFVTWHGND